ncbi:hypothetical protein BKA93DRAFT_878087 [Sparassis latifolia]
MARQRHVWEETRKDGRNKQDDEKQSNGEESNSSPLWIGVAAVSHAGRPRKIQVRPAVVRRRLSHALLACANARTAAVVRSFVNPLISWVIRTVIYPYSTPMPFPAPALPGARTLLLRVAGVWLCRADEDRGALCGHRGVGGESNGGVGGSGGSREVERRDSRGLGRQGSRGHGRWTCMTVDAQSRAVVAARLWLARADEDRGERDGGVRGEWDRGVREERGGGLREHSRAGSSHTDVGAVNVNAQHPARVNGTAALEGSVTAVVRAWTARAEGDGGIDESGTAVVRPRRPRAPRSRVLLLGARGAWPARADEDGGVDKSRMAVVACSRGRGRRRIVRGRRASSG